MIQAQNKRLNQFGLRGITKVNAQCQMYLLDAQYREMTALLSDTLKRLVVFGYGVNGYIFIQVTGLCIFL
jgi:hypothetical protein